MTNLESFLAESLIVVFHLNRIPVRLDFIWNLFGRIADEFHKCAQLWLFDAIGRLKLKAESLLRCLAEKLHGHLVFWGEVLGHPLAALSFFEIINERNGMAADGLFLEEVTQVYYDLASDRRRWPAYHIRFL